MSSDSMDQPRNPVGRLVGSWVCVGVVDGSLCKGIVASLRCGSPVQAERLVVWNRADLH